MAAETPRIDHPLTRLLLTTALAIAIALATLAIEPFILDAQRGWILLFIPFAAGAALFLIYAPAGIRHGRSHERRIGRLVRWFGLSFLLWGPPVAIFCGGVFGLLHALICAAALLQITREEAFGALPPLALVPAWSITWIIHERSIAVSESATLWTLLPVLIWNITMAAGLAAWSAWRCRHPLANPAGECPVCGYDLTGLRRPVCPECGADVTLAAPGSADPR